MFNALPRTATMMSAHRPLVITILTIALILLTACGGSGAAPAASTASAAASNSTSTDQVVITGAITKTSTPVEVIAVKVADNIGINVNEHAVCGVSIQFSEALQPGTYPIGDHLHQPVVDVLGEYGFACENTRTYLSTRGTLTLTASGATFSGTFDFTAGNTKDESKSIHVVGVFHDVAHP